VVDKSRIVGVKIRIELWCGILLVSLYSSIEIYKRSQTADL
jgi:hypothetical protein